LLEKRTTHIVSAIYATSRLLFAVLQTIKEQCQPTSDWAQYAQQMIEQRLMTVSVAPDAENHLNDPTNMLMTTNCWKCRSANRPPFP